MRTGLRTDSHGENHPTRGIEHCFQIGLKGFWIFYLKKAKISATFLKF